MVQHTYKDLHSFSKKDELQMPTKYRIMKNENKSEKWFHEPIRH